jgi:hypothetical protein
VKEPRRNLIILKTFEIDALNTLIADNMATKGKWSIEIGKRLGKNFNYDVFSDVILPVTFENTGSFSSSTLKRGRQQWCISRERQE